MGIVSVSDNGLLGVRPKAVPLPTPGSLSKKNSAATILLPAILVLSFALIKKDATS